jgi:hypothetical protein
MPESVLFPLVGHRVTTADVVHDYVQLRFDNGDVLNVFNDYEIEGSSLATLHALIGKCVVAVSTQPREVRLELGELSLIVSLLDTAYRDAEAIEYIPSSGSRVVWS